MDAITFEVLLVIIMLEAIVALALYIENRISDIIMRKKMQLAELLMRYDKEE